MYSRFYERERFYKLWLANKANRLRQGLDDLAHFIKLFHINDIHAGTKLFIADVTMPAQACSTKFLHIQSAANCFGS